MKKVVLAMCFLICLATGAVAGWKLYGYYHIYQEGKKEYKELTECIEKREFSEKSDKVKNNKADKCPVKVDFKSLKKINPDVIAWIHIPDTGIDYPIVQAKDNTTYLHRTFRKKDSYVGAIFMDSLCAPNLSSFNSIIYGHNLKTGEMFGHLKKLYDTSYNEKANYKKHPKVWIITPDIAQEYVIFAFREINVKKDKDIYTIELPDRKERRIFLDHQIRKSQKDTGIRPSENTKMITLSTCTSRTEDGRFIVQAVLE